MKLGRRQPHSPDTHPRLRLGDFLTPGAVDVAPIVVVDWVSKVRSWPMYANDQWGDCVWAMIGHAIEAFTTYGQGRTITVTEADVLKGYSDVTGFDPNAGPSGNNPTDQGTVIQDALNYWRTTGIAGHKILAFAEVNVHNPVEVMNAMNLFGHLMIGVDFPKSAMSQFNHGQPWDVVPDDGGNEGGHAVDLGFDNAGRLKVVTWATVQDMTGAFWAKYVSEAWVVLSPEWLTATGTCPAGLDYPALAAAYHQLTGKDLPVLPVGPTPTPAPVPTPGPTQDPADLALIHALQTWLGEHHVGDNAAAVKAINVWRKAKHL